MLELRAERDGEARFVISPISELRIVHQDGMLGYFRWTWSAFNKDGNLTPMMDRYAAVHLIRRRWPDMGDVDEKLWQGREARS